MSQAKYIEEVLKHFGIEDCKQIATLLDANAKLIKLSDKDYNADSGWPMYPTSKNQGGVIRWP